MIGNAEPVVPEIPEPSEESRLRQSVSLVIVNYGTPQLVTAQLDSLARHADASLVSEAIVVDNGFPQRGDCRDSLDPSRYPFPIEWVGNPQSSYASGVNRGAAMANGETVAIANSDVEWLPGTSVAPILRALQENARIGVAGPQLVFPDLTWQRSFGPFPSVRQALLGNLWVELATNAVRSWRHARGVPRRPRDVEYVDGSFMMIRRVCFEELGGFDERFGFYCEDADFCLRAARAGWRRVFVPEARLLHIRGASSTSVASRAFIGRQFAATRTFVRRHFGRTHARAFAALQLVLTAQIAVVYRTVSAVRSNERWRRRSLAANDSLAAAWALGLDVSDGDAAG